MPLTYHLYTQDEVAAALMFCALRGKSVEATFWCKELLDSNLVEEVMKALEEVWLYGFGIKALGWYRNYQEIFHDDQVVEEHIFKLVSGLCRLASNGGRDRSILTLLSTEVVPDRVNVCDIPAGFTDLEAFAFRAILQRKTLAAWGAVRNIEAPDAFLQNVAMHKHGIEAIKCIAMLEGEAWQRRAIVVAALCLSKEEFAASWNQPLHPILDEVVKELPEWETLLGRRARRKYRIPPECLGYTRRGKLSVYISNEKEILGSMEKPSALWYSPFWDSVAELYGGWEAVKQDAVIRDAFYEKYFPDDIPDEWSNEERAKSHGSGGSTNKSKTIQSWYGRLPAAVLWGPLTYRELVIGPVDIRAWNLLPVRRIIGPESV
ncbi:hypothetical protein EBR66_06790 [bacterium]|nr:hypothetical protein [bacterium]